MTENNTPSSAMPEKAPPSAMDELFENDEGEQKDTIDYDYLLNVQVKQRTLEDEDEDLSKKVVFYCRDCQQICNAQKKKGKKLNFICDVCTGGNIYFGSELGIRGFFRK